MDHIKTHYAMLLDTPNDQIIIEGPLSANDLEKYHFHEDLTAFRPANQQFQAILNIADLPEGRIIVARTKTMIIGYVTYLYPDPLERWSKFNMDNLIVLGAIEVIPKYRGARVASSLLHLSMLDDYMENYIIISTEYYWHWDLKRTKLSLWEYRKVMEKMMAHGGLTPATTDDPEIISHPANCLVVRIGKKVPEKSIAQFDTLRFLGQQKYKMNKEHT